VSPAAQEGGRGSVAKEVLPPSSAPGKNTEREAVQVEVFIEAAASAMIEIWRRQEQLQTGICCI